MGANPGITVTAPTPGTYRFKGSTTTGAGSWDDLTGVVHVDAGTYTMDATDWPLGNNSWLMGIQAISPTTTGAKEQMRSDLGTMGRKP